MLERKLKRFITAAFVLSSIFVSPGIIVTEAGAQGCGPGVPDAWTRPGGFCDQLGGRSLSLPNEGRPYQYILPVSSLGTTGPDIRVHVAETCAVDCSIYESSVVLPTMQMGDRARVADIPLECQD